MNDFLVRMNQKTEKQKKGTIGELLSHIFIRYNSDKFKIISSIFNLEEKSAKKSFDVVITDNEENSIWLTEVKSATVSEKESSQKKNITLIETAKNSIIDKFNKNDQSNWYNARNHASKIIKNNSNVMETIDKLYNRKIDLENHKNVILSSVVYNNIHDKIEFDGTLRHKYKILKEGSFRKLIIFSIQQEEYEKVIEFLQEELNNCEFVELHKDNSNNNRSDYNITINDIINRKYFIDIYTKLLKHDYCINDLEKLILFLYSIFFINHKNTNFNKLGYRIILKYSNLFNDYIPLYDISINLNYIPICHFIEKMVKYNLFFEERFNNMLMSSYCNFFKDNDDNIYFTGKQKELKEYFIKNQKLDTLVIAPTSYGKSELILSLISNFDRMVIIVPIKSLISQQKKKIVSYINSKNIKIPIFDNIDSYKSSIKNNKYICVLTQERLEQFINNNVKFDIAFIDEAHNILGDDNRALTLSKCILHLKNSNTILKFFTPFINDPKNLTFNDDMISFEKIDNKSSYFAIEENIKSENYYLIDFTKEKHVLQLYDHYFYNFPNNPFYIKTLDNTDYINFILEYSDNKNLIYINSTVNILDFINKFYNRIYQKILDKKINKFIKAISDYITDDFILSKCLEKGFIFHFGNLPDNMKIYIEYIYKKNDMIRFIISSSTLLEGINIPIYNIFMLDRTIGNKLLNNSQFRNLVGRACRLNDIFNGESNNLMKLEPNIYNIKFRENNSDDLETFLEKVLNKKSKDDVRNPYLKYGINKKKHKEIEEKVANTSSDFILSNNLFNFNMFPNIDISEYDQINKKASKIKNKLNKQNIKITDLLDLLNKTREIFYFKKKSNKLKILHYRSTINLLVDIINDRIDSNYKQRIYSFKKSINNKNNITKNKLLYVGTKFGNKQLNQNAKTEFISIKDIDNSLALFLLQEFDNEIDYNLQKYFDLIYSYGIVEEELINKIKYRTTNKEKIKIIDNGISFTLANILIDNRYSKFYNILDNKIDKDIITEMDKNKENDIIIFEMKNYLGLV